MKNIEIESERLILKSFTLEFATTRYLNWLKDKDITKYLHFNPSDYDIEKLTNYISNKINDDKCELFAILIKENGKLLHIGNCKLEPINYKEKHAVLGLIIGDKKYHRKGIGYETINLVINFLKKSNFKKIYLGVSEYNTNAFNLYKKIGFKIIEKDNTPLGKKKIKEQIRMEYIISP